MKKILMSIFFLTLIIGVKAQKGVPNVIKVNPLGLLFGNASVSYEHALNAKSSFQINGNFGGLKIAGVKYSSFGGGADYRRYFSSSKEAPKGFYASPGAAFYTQKVDLGSSLGSGTSSGFVIKAVVGNQWIWNSGFALDLFGGINYYGGGKVKISGTEYGKFSGVLPALGVSLGYAF